MFNAFRIEGRESLALLIVQAALGYEWAVAGWEKVVDASFADGFGGAIARFASQNPHPAYKAFLEGWAAANGEVLAFLVAWGELAVGVALLATLLAYCHRSANVRKLGSGLAIIAIAGGLAMNLNFLYAAGWTSPSTHGINAVMFWAQVGLLAAWVPLLTPGARRSA